MFKNAQKEFEGFPALMTSPLVQADVARLRQEAEQQSSSGESSARTHVRCILSVCVLLEYAYSMVMMVFGEDSCNESGVWSCYANPSGSCFHVAQCMHVTYCCKVLTAPYHGQGYSNCSCLYMAALGNDVRARKCFEEWTVTSRRKLWYPVQCTEGECHIFQHKFFPTCLPQLFTAAGRSREWPAASMALTASKLLYTPMQGHYRHRCRIIWPGSIGRSPLAGSNINALGCASCWRCWLLSTSRMEEEPVPLECQDHGAERWASD